MEFKCTFILILLVYLPVLITGQYTLRGVPQSYAVLDDNYRLQCDVTDSASLVTFNRNDINVCSTPPSTCESNIQGRYNCGCINNNNKTLYLNIININIQDDTTWSCRGNNGGQGSTTVSVYYGPENIRFNPTSDNIDVIEGKSQSINCLADCRPDCNITWSKDGSTTTLNNPLSLSTRNQTGYYTCTVKHTVLNKQLTKQLNVQIYYGPDELTFSPDVTSINIIEDRDQTITCLTKCVNCNYKWTGPVSSPTIYLVLTQVKRNQEGNYTCEATNIKDTNPKTRSKSIQVNVHYPPDITSITSDAINNETDEGSGVIFNCNVDSNPVSTITWSSSTSTDTNTGQQWTLTQAKCQDTGIYTCTAKNGIGQSTTKSLPLNIRCPPTLKEELKKEIKGKVGDMVLLEINIEAYPAPSFIWKQLISDVEYPFAKTEKVSENNFISTLELILDQSSFGYYIITVQNIINGETRVKTWGIKITQQEVTVNSCNQTGDKTDYQEGLRTGFQEGEETGYQEGLGTGIGIGIGISVVCVMLAILAIFSYRKYHPAKKTIPEESYATFSNRNLEDRTYEDFNTRPEDFNTRPEVDDNTVHNGGVKEYENM